MTEAGNLTMVKSDDLQATATGEFPAWDVTEPDASLAAIYSWATRATQNYSTWYDGKKKPCKLWSKWLRFFAVLFFGVGALCPLVDATGVFDKLDAAGAVIAARNHFLFGQWGYVAIALAAAILAFDFYFGYSSSWMRFIVTQTSIERSLKEFQYDWTMLKAQQQQQQNASANTAPMFLQRAKDFTLQIEAVVKQETDAWVAEFQNNISQLEKVLKTEIETRKPGSIKVTVKNCADFDKISILLDGNPVKDLEGVSEGILNVVPPGRYEVTLVGAKNGKERRAAKVVEVQADQMAAADFALPALQN